MSINKDLTALILQDTTPTDRLGAEEPRTKIPLRVGRSTGTSEVAEVAPANVPVLYREVITVYSVIVLTADGAFERPPDWPTDGTYPGSSTELDPDEPYYEQKRVHAVFYDTQTTALTEYDYLIDLESPYTGLMNTLSDVDLSKVVLYKTVKNGGLSDALINAKADELTAMGII
jgi:hypothetical protein